MISVAPGAAFTADAAFGPSYSGLATVGVQILQAGVPVSGFSRTTSGVAESPSGSGGYAKDYAAAPTAKGYYRLAFDTGGSSPQWAFEDLLVTSDLPVTPTGGTGNERYLTSDELKASLQMTGVTFADADIAVAIETASRYLEDEYNDGRTWLAGNPGEQRYYTRSDGWTVELGDVLTVTGIDLDFALDPLRPGR